MATSSLSISSHGSRTSSAMDKSQKALMLSTKVKSFRNSMNPYQLGDSSHHHHHQRTQIKQPETMDRSSDQDDVDIGTDIDESAKHIDDDDESSFAEDTGGLEYLLGGGQEEEVSSDEEDRGINSPGSPSSVIDIFPTDSSQKSRSSRSSERRNTVSACHVVPNKFTEDGDNGSTGTPEANRKARRRSTQTHTSGGQGSLMIGDKSERATSQDKTGKKSKRSKNQGEDQRRRNTKRIIGSDTDDTAESARKCEASAVSEGRIGRDDDGGGTSGEETLSPIRRPTTTRRQKKDMPSGSDHRNSSDLLGLSEHKNNKVAPRKPRRQQQRRGSTGSSVAENVGFEEASDKAETTGERKKRGEEKRPSRESQALSRGSSHRRMLGKGSNHSDKRSNKSRRGSRSVSIGSNNEATASKSDKKNENAAISIASRNEIRKDAVLKKRSKFINQKSAVRPIVRRAKSKSRRASVQDLPPAEPAEPIVGYGHSFSGSVSSLTISTGTGSKDDFSLPSPGVFSTKKTFLGEVSAHERTSAALSRWQALPKVCQTSSDGTPTPPSHDLSSLCSPGVISHKHRTATFSPLPLSSLSEHCASHTTPSSITKHSSLSSSIQSMVLGDKQLHSNSKNKFCPEIVVPETPTRSMAGMVSELSTPAVATPGTKDSSQASSLHSKLKLLSSGGPLIKIGEDTPGGYVSELTTTPCISRNVGPDLRSRLMEVAQDVPVTPSLPIGVGGCELDTPGGVVSELTVGSLLSSSSSLVSCDHQRNKLSTWMTNVQSVMLNESEYHCRDGIPKMARRHSFDSISYIEEEDLPAGTTENDLKESDFAPKAPARQVSFSSMLL